MASKSSQGAAQNTGGALSPESYAAFIRQIELTAVWLHEARIVNHHGPEPSEDAEVHVTTEAHWKQHTDGFRAFHHYAVVPEWAGNQLAQIEVTCGLHFTSTEPMTDGIFEVFREVNLPVNTWPYLREFVASSTGRMNWLAFTLPTLKRGTE
ncbi:MAG: hypothetical protein ACR2PL_28505, partial [Dehalococcoidia bacterium]